MLEIKHVVKACQIAKKIIHLAPVETRLNVQMIKEDGIFFII
jgi:hypothetical protein